MNTRAIGEKCWKLLYLTWLNIFSYLTCQEQQKSLIRFKSLNLLKKKHSFEFIQEKKFHDKFLKVTLPV